MVVVRARLCDALDVGVAGRRILVPIGELRFDEEALRIGELGGEVLGLVELCLPFGARLHHADERVGKGEVGIGGEGLGAEIERFLIAPVVE